MNATTTGQFVIRKSRDAEDREYPFLVLDPDGDVADQFETLAEAVQDAAERQVDWDAEQDEERRAILRDAISDLVDDCDSLVLLERVVQLLTIGE